MFNRNYLLVFILFAACAPEFYLLDVINTIRYENLEVSTTDDITTIEFIDEQTGFIGTSGGKLFKTTNQGLSWISTTSPTSGVINTITFVTSSVGFAGTSTGLFKTINAGVSWVLVDEKPVVSISFPSPNVGYAVSRDNFYIKTIDGGDFGKLDISRHFHLLLVFRTTFMR